MHENILLPIVKVIMVKMFLIVVMFFSLTFIEMQKSIKITNLAREYIEEICLKGKFSKREYELFKRSILTVDKMSINMKVERENVNLLKDKNYYYNVEKAFLVDEANLKKSDLLKLELRNKKRSIVFVERILND